ncbi:MAG: FtsL-like putative cell division protein [Lepagella sp.]
MRYGRTISIEFFKSNAWLLVIIIAIVISLMGLRYKTKTKMVEIKNLTKELELAESEKLREKAAYMSLIRETEMKRMVREKGLPLEFQEQPPYQLIDNNNQNQ